MDPQLAAIAAHRHGVFTRREALAAGCTPREIDASLRYRRWTALRRGIYVDSSEAERVTDDARARHLMLAAAAQLSMTVPTVVSHRTAAIAWDIPLIGQVPTVPALTTERQHRRRSPGVELHTAVTPDRHRADAEGLTATSPARTLSDLARSIRFPAAVAAMDAALHGGLCTLRDVDAVIADCWVWPGIARVKRVLALADPRSESVGESISRVAMVAADLPAPELQVELHLDGRRFRVDFMWPDRGVVGEFDGRVKYATRDDVWSEKQREDLIRRHGNRVVRWTWADVHPRPDAMVARLRAALRH